MRSRVKVSENSLGPARTWIKNMKTKAKSSNRMLMAEWMSQWAPVATNTLEEDKSFTVGASTFVYPKAAKRFLVIRFQT